MFKFRLLFILSLILIMFTACAEVEEEQEKTEEKERIKVGLAMGYGGIGDMAFNDCQYNGLIEASRLYPVEVCYKVPASDTHKAVYSIIESLIVDEQCSLVFSAGYLAKEPIEDLSVRYPEVDFVLLDDKISKERENAVSVLFKQNEGSYLAGILAAELTKTGKIAFLGGVDEEVIFSFFEGFKQGVQYNYSGIRLVEKYISRKPDYSGFNDPEKGYEIAEKLYQSGVDIIYSVAGASGTGVIQCAKEKGGYVIGVDADQDHLAKGYVLTSMMKRLDRALIDLIGIYVREKKFDKQIYTGDLENNWISLSEMLYTQHLIDDDLLHTLEEQRQAVIDGDVVVSNYHWY